MLLGCLGTASAWGQDQPNQTLDQVDAFNANKVLEMAFDRQNPATLPDFSEPDLGSPAGLAACKLASSGLYCLATNGSGSQVVRQWTLPLAVTNATPPVDRFSCADSALGLNGGTCTGMTVDVSGAIWVSGKKASIPSDYSLVKVVKTSALPNGCTNGWTAVTTAPASTPLCAREFATGSGVLSDLDAVDGEVAYPPTLPIGPGILALNSASGDVRYFALSSPGQTPLTFSNWGLDAAAGERLLSTSLLQRKATVNNVPNVVIGNYILAATTTGRILSIDVTSPSGTSASQVGTIPQAQQPITINSSSCTSGTTTCNVTGATLSATRPGATSGTTVAANFFVRTPLGGKSGLGVQGKVPGEIAIGETLNVQFHG